MVPHHVTNQLIDRVMVEQRCRRQQQPALLVDAVDQSDRDDRVHPVLREAAIRFDRTRVHPQRLGNRVDHDLTNTIRQHPIRDNNVPNGTRLLRQL